MPTTDSFCYAVVGAESDGSIAAVLRNPASCRAAEDSPAIATPGMNMEAEHIAIPIRKRIRGKRVLGFTIYCNCDIPFFMTHFNIVMGFDNLRKRIDSVHLLSE
jgi:hypothetical protein